MVRVTCLHCSYVFSCKNRTKDPFCPKCNSIVILPDEVKDPNPELLYAEDEESSQSAPKTIIKEPKDHGTTKKTSPNQNTRGIKRRPTRKPVEESPKEEEDTGEDYDDWGV